MSGARSNPLVDLSTVLQNLFLGKGQSTSETGTVKSRADEPVIDRLKSLMDEAITNSNNPTAVQPIVDKIIKDATIAFSPQLAREASSGMYGSTARQMLANQAAGEAASAASGAVLNYKTGQQQIATQAGNALVNATKTTTTQTGQRAATNPAIPGGISSLAAGGLGLYSLYRNKDKLVNFLTGGAGAGDFVSRATQAANDLLNPLDFMGIGQGAGGGLAAEYAAAANDLLAPLDFLSPAAAAGVPDFVANIPGVPTFAQYSFDSILGDIPDLLPEVGSWVGDAIDITGDALGWAGDAADITDLFGDFGDVASNIFDEILSFF